MAPHICLSGTENAHKKKTHIKRISEGVREEGGPEGGGFGVRILLTYAGVVFSSQHTAHK